MKCYFSIEAPTLGIFVDADLARSVAESTTVQVRQQLSIQTLGIANRQPSTLLDLFG